MAMDIASSKNIYKINGMYENKQNDPSMMYGQNAVNNFKKYVEKPISETTFNPAPILDFRPTEEANENNIRKLEKFIDSNNQYLESLPPLEFEYRYMPVNPVGKVDKKSVLAAAIEEMTAKEMSVREFENKFLIDTENMTAEPLDINKDGKIDAAEYSANIIAADLLSKGTTDPSKVDGTINAQGMNAILAYTQKANAEAASKLYTEIYNRFDLGSALNEIE